MVSTIYVHFDTVQAPTGLRARQPRELLGSLWPPASAWALPGSPHWESCVCEFFEWGICGILQLDLDADSYLFLMLCSSSLWVEIVQSTKVCTAWCCRCHMTVCDARGEPARPSAPVNNTALRLGADAGIGGAVCWLGRCFLCARSLQDPGHLAAAGAGSESEVAGWHRQ
jgi:hypothetical protein